MELRWLHAFVAVAEELHFGRAAARLQMAQSPLSQTIRKLEKDIGVPLFDRSTRSVALTAGGHTFLPHAYRVLEDVETARQAARASAGGRLWPRHDRLRRSTEPPSAAPADSCSAPTLPGHRVDAARARVDT